jgi:hypothetical protein
MIINENTPIETFQREIQPAHESPAVSIKLLF